MSVPAAYIGVILIWTTTPLTIKWSSEGPGFLFAVVSRMCIGTFCLLLLSSALRKPLLWHRSAQMSYAISACSIYGAMLAVYWGAQFIPSGWISVIFGLSPILTAWLASVLLHEKMLTLSKISAMALGVCGLVVLFGSAIELGPDAALGVAAVVSSVLIFSASSVGLKKVGGHLPALTVTTGGLLFALPAYLLTWWFSGAQWPAELPVRSSLSILYLGVIATSFGFVMYFYVLKNMAATRVALITLVTPVLALLLGNSLNGETITIDVWLGTALILAALVLFEWPSFGKRRAPEHAHVELVTPEVAEET